MSGLEVVIIVGGAIYITKKVRERKEKKRLEKNAASEVNAAHGRAETTQTPTRNSQNGRLRQQVPTREEEALPTYKAPVGPLPSSNRTDMTWSDTIHLPTYDELSRSSPAKGIAVGDEKQRGDNAFSRMKSNQRSSPTTPLASSLSPASEQPSHLSPAAHNASPSGTSDKKRKFWRRLSSSKAIAT